MADLQDRTRTPRASRRGFLKTAVASTAALASTGGLQTIAAQSPQSRNPAAPGSTTRLSEHLAVYHGPINVGILRDGDQALLIDCGDGSVSKALPELGISAVKQILFTHHHRDQVCGAYAMAAAGTKIGVPAAERPYFVDPAEYWTDQHVWRIFQSFRPDRLMLTRPLRVDQAFGDGHEMTFGPAKIRVLDTPGHTEGAVSYLVEVDGNRVVFSGDCIYDEGQVWDVYSMQKGFSSGGQKIGGYHGFMGDRWRLVESLGRINNLRPSVLVPSHGNLINQPAKAIDTLTRRFETCYENYVGISALRHYFPRLFTQYEGRPGQMPIRQGVAPPECLRHFGTTWMLISKSGAGFVMDAGSPGTVDEIKKRMQIGQINSVEALWVTHYHFDHTDGIPKFQQEFDCPCITDRRLAEVLTSPRAWRLPCLSAVPIRVHRPMKDGQSWQWHEFKLTSYFCPGQTLYHAALLVESEGLRMLFVGDSHTPSGIDDYCAYNRNWLGRDAGFQYCISLIERLEPTHIFNCHVDVAFTFTPEEIRFMRKNLDRREELFGELVPWDHANYGLDASWVRCHPYAQNAKPGGKLRLNVVFTNHSTKPQRAACRAVLPKAFGGRPTEWVDTEVPAKTEKDVPLAFPLPAGAGSGRYVVPVDVKFGPRHLPQFAEAIVDV